MAIVALIACWIVAYFILQNEYLLPSPWDTLIAAGGLFAEGAFYLAFLNTFWRVLLAFALSFAMGISVALAATLWGWVRAFVAPIISFFRTLPTMAIMLLLLIWSSPRFAPVIVTFLVLFPIVYSEALASFDGVKEDYSKVFEAYRVPKKRQVSRAYLPLSAPMMLAQTGALLAMGLKVTISAEVLALTYQSMGGMMNEAQLYLQTTRLLALTLVAVALGFVFEGVSALVKKKVVRWRE